MRNERNYRADPVRPAGDFVYGYTYVIGGDGNRVGATTGTLTQDFTPYTLIGPVHAVTNTYEATRDALVQKANTRNAGSTNVFTIGYTVNALGQRTHAARSGAAANSTDWTYDDRGQVNLATDSASAANRAYAYDYIGNRTKAADSLTLPTDPNYASNALNQYTAAPNPPASPVYSYDADGNAIAFPLTPDGTTTAQNAALVWDAENRLVSSTPSGGSATTYLYDALGRRIAKKHGTDAQRIYLYDGFNLIAEYSDTTLAKTFTWGLDISGSLQGAGGVGGLLATQLHTGDNAGVYYPTYDGNGNVSEYLKSNGDVAAHYEYGPFGEPLVSTGAVAAEMPFRFSTHYTDDEAGLVYAKRRYYSPITGRWLSRDPIGEEGGINLYGYVGNSPTNRIDPLGLWPNSLTGNPTNAAIAAQAMADLGGSAAATGAVLTAAQIAVKELEHTNYSRRCSEKPPSGLCCCELARWILGQREDCLSMRQDFANKWYSGGYDPGHAEFMKNQARAIEKARAAVERLCR